MDPTLAIAGIPPLSLLLSKMRILASGLPGVAVPALMHMVAPGSTLLILYVLGLRPRC